MPAFAAQYRFAAEFTVFLVALAGLAMVVLRGEPVSTSRLARVALGVGFAGTGAASFLQGSLLVENDDALVALRAAGVVALFIGSLGWRGSALSRVLLWIGTAGLLVSIPLGQRAGDSLAGTTIAAVGALLVGAALLSASRRSIAARVAASAAGTLLLLVLVLSVALSTVLATTVEDDALADLDDRALREVLAIESRNEEMVKDASVVAALLVRLQQNPDDLGSPRLLGQLDPAGTPTPQQVSAITRELDRAREELYVGVAFGYVTEAQRLVAGSGADPLVFAGIGRSPLVTAALRATPRRGGASTQVIDGGAFNVGVAPIVLQGPAGLEPFGAVIALFPLDDAYLEARGGEGTALALASGDRVIADVGMLPERPVLRRLASDVLGGVPRRAVATEERFAAARPVLVAEDQRPVLALVVAESTVRAADVRDDLFQTFFVIAFGGTVLALLLAALVGDRIGAGIRRLTTSAEAIQLGALGVRSGVRSEDEVGVLGATFDSMAASIEQQTDELQAAAARVEAIVAGMGEALVAVDGTGSITDFNAAAEELLARNGDEARGRRVDEVLTLSGEDGTDLTARLRSPEQVRWSALGEVSAPGRPSVPVAVTAGALRGADGAVEGAVVVLRDLRGEREVERMKRHFLSRVGHELRTPLTPLIGYSQLLVGRPMPQERAKPVYESILASAKRLERIVEMLEFFASLDAGRQVLRPERVDVRAVLEGVVTARAALLDGRHTLAKRISRVTPPAFVDGRWLARSVEELIDNAVKFSPDGGRIVVSGGPSAADPAMVEIAVRDPGVGMSPEEVERAFAEWAQGDESDTRSFGGLGLGLALVQRVVEHHGGRVLCTTAPGKGAKFSILLPAAPSDAPGALVAADGGPDGEAQAPPTAPAGADRSPSGAGPDT